MLAAISTTILSRRSCAETCSAMVSRSRLNKTRGPPDALRMCQNPPPQSRPAEWPVAGVKRTKINNFSHSAPPAGPGSAESRSPKLWHSLRQPTSQAYSQSRLVLPSKRPARNNNVWVIGDAATAKLDDLPKHRRSDDQTMRIREKIVLGLVEPVERMQRTYRQ